jgi:hypothetical protein
VRAEAEKAERIGTGAGARVGAARRGIDGGESAEETIAAKATTAAAVRVALNGDPDGKTYQEALREERIA